MRDMIEGQVVGRLLLHNRCVVTTMKSSRDDVFKIAWYVVNDRDQS
jgi:hypothetical protein